MLNNLISKAKRPLILAGNGVYLSNTVKSLEIFKRCKLPVVLSLPAMGCINKNDKNNVV